MTQARKLTALIGWSKTQGAMIPTVASQAGHEGQRLPMAAVPHHGDQPLAEQAASMQSSASSSWPRRSRRYKDQHGINFALQPLPPARGVAPHVMAILLAGVQCFL